MFLIEEKVIDVILEVIRDNQKYLTQPENLPQLTKLGNKLTKNENRTF